jgi:hypothetical protein
MNNPDWFIIVFLPGAGGNHLANIISTDKKFAGRIDSNFYNQNRIVAHPISSELEISIHDQIHNAIGCNYVFCCHLGVLQWNLDDFNNSIADKKIIVIEFSQKPRPKLFIKRISTPGHYWLPSYKIEEYSWLYSVDVIRKLFEFTDVTPLSVDMLFDPDSRRLVDCLHKEFNLQLNYDQIQHMHTNWLASITKNYHELSSNY